MVTQEYLKEALFYNEKTGEFSWLAGVSFSKGKYRVRISRNGNEVALGTYSDYFLACCAKKSAEHKFGFGVHHGRKQNQ